MAQNLVLHSNTAVVAAASTWDHVICSNKKKYDDKPKPRTWSDILARCLHFVHNHKMA